MWDQIRCTLLMLGLQPQIEAVCAYTEFHPIGNIILLHSPPPPPQNHSSDDIQRMLYNIFVWVGF